MAHFLLKSLKALLVPTVVLLLAGCSSDNEGSKVLATVNGQNVTVKEYKDELSRQPLQVQQYAQSEQGKQVIVNELINREVLRQEGKKRGLDKDPKVLAASEKGKLDLRKQLQEQLQTIKMAQKRIEKDAMDQALFQELVRLDIENKLRVSDKEVRTYYDYHKTEFKKPDGSLATFAEASQQARQQALRTKEREQMNVWIADLQKGARIQINQENFKTLR